jgi:hypothetical protein
MVSGSGPVVRDDSVAVEFDENDWSPTRAGC